MISANIYDNADLVTLADGTEILERKPLGFVPSVGDSWAVVRHGDTLDRIAAAAYGGFVTRPDLLWWVIADANNIENPMLLGDFVGRFLLVPEFGRLLAALEGDNTEEASELVQDVNVLVNPIALPTLPTTTPTVGGNVDTPPTTPTAPKYLVLKNVGGGYSLITGDADGAIRLDSYIDISKYPNAIIFETLAVENNNTGK